MFEAVHVDHPDEHRCYWVLPDLLPPQHGVKLPDPLHRQTAGQACHSVCL